MMKEFINRVMESALEAGISPVELAYVKSESFSVCIRDGKMENYEVCDEVSLVMRGNVGEKIGVARTDLIEEDSIPFLISSVKESAEMVEADEQNRILPPDEHYEDVPCYAPELDAVTAQEKIGLAFRIDEEMHKFKDIRPNRTVLATSSGEKHMVNSLGMDLHGRRNMVMAYTGAFAEKGEKSATESVNRWGFGMEVVDPTGMAEECHKKLLDKLDAVRIRSGVYPAVILNTEVAGILSTFSSVYSADAAQKGLSMLAGKEGTGIASPVVTIRDDALIPWSLGGTAFDREGAATQNTCVVEQGVLKTLLHNRKTAARAGVKTTGNAAGGGKVTTTNFYMEKGEKTLETLLRDTGEGVLITELSGMHAGANPISGDFSLLARGFMIRDGRQAEPVEQFTVAGNYYQLLRDIQDVGADLLFDASPIGAPSIRVRSVNVAGADEV